MLARVAEAGGMELRIFTRDGRRFSASARPSLAEAPDSNADLMAEFLNDKNGQTWQSIPVAVFYTKDLEYLYHYTEFPAIYHKDRLVSGHIRAPRPGETNDETQARADREFMALQQSPFFRLWASAAVDEIISALHRRLVVGAHGTESTMPIARLSGVELYYEETGAGVPLVWSHEFGGDHRSWEPQVRYFARGYRVVTYNHRGYAPSSVPVEATAYSQDILVEDLFRLLRHLGLGPVHLGGCSMGANVARDFAIAHPELVRSLIMVGAGAGSVNREQFLKGQAATADGLEREGMASRLRSFETPAHAGVLQGQGPARLRRVHAPGGRARCRGRARTSRAR